MAGPALAWLLAVGSLAGAGEVRSVRDAVPDRYIVVLKPAVRQARGSPDVAAVARQLLTRHGGQLRHVYRHALEGFSARMTRAQAEALALESPVDYVEEDGRMTMSTVQTGATWGLDRIDQRDLPLNTTYQYNFSGAGVHAYILDTGIRSTHTDFGGRIGNSVCTVDPPCLTVTVTLPSPFEQAPVNVGVVSFVKPLLTGAVSVTVGALFTTVTAPESEPLLATLSVPVTVKLFAPALRAAFAVWSGLR